jgi:hypothetical protein
MNIPPWLLLTALLFAGDLRAEDAQASLYVVDRSPEHAEMEGLCLTYDPALEPGPQRDLLAIAKGPVGSTIVMIAFGPEGVHQNLSPVVALQTAETGPARFPSAETKQVWKYDGPQGGVELYIAAFADGDPDLARLSEYLGWLNEALSSDAPADATLHALALKKRFSGILRERSSETFLVKFDDPRVPAAPKAATTRSSKSALPGSPANGGEKETSPAFPDPLVDAAPRVPSSPVAAVRRGLAHLDEEWREDSRTITYETGKPGILIFPLTAPTVP